MSIPRFRLEWGRDRSQDFSSLDEMTGIVARIQMDEYRGQPIVVEVIDSLGNSLAFSVGEEECFLNYVGSTGEPPYLSVCGNPGKQGIRVVRFRDEWTEIPAELFVPKTKALKAVEYFLKNGVPDPSLQWVED